MEGSAKQKVPGGKLLTVKLKYADKIDEIQILGDFFIYPEKALGIIEKRLVGVKTHMSEEDITVMIAQIVKDNNIEMIGITPGAIAQTIKMVTK